MTALPPDVHPEGRYSAVDTARLLGISRTTLWRLATAGILSPRYTRNTLRPRYRGKDILAYWRAEI